ncbi:hypothetical protein [Wolbachia endosymbiont of Bemisia tabaci]|uniref:hypothetical protein n=1 Tax=Wolbachia endosymbiont of Bemisia tabaci TaxID=215173 RepID=UPI00210769EB|nr:hypothetical protein [Wolbachia endosymbiont of Bemisia tabaci]
MQDKVKKWQEQMELNEQNSGRFVNQQRTHDRKIWTKAGFNVEEIKHKYERRDSGYDSGYDSDTKVEQKLELGSKAPKSEIGSVSIEHGVIGGCRYKITDISL